MSGIGSTLSIAKTAIQAQQYGLNITGNNIANVNNPNYSVQSAEHKNMTPALYAGFLFGTGVQIDQVQQSVDKLLENRLTAQKSTQESYIEQESYINILEGFFDENSDTSINTLLSEFWNSWQDLSDNPLGSAERVNIHENGQKLAARFKSAFIDLSDLSKDIRSEIESGVTKINSLTSKIADMNRQIVGLELGRTANDQRDQRNALVDELGEMIDINSFEKPNGAIIINAATGFSIVSGVDTNKLVVQNGNVMWRSSYGANLDISDKISGGKLAGWLEMKDDIIPKYSNQLKVLSREMIWAMNYQHSQGAGLDYFTGIMIGNYKADDSEWLSSLEFGDKIDYSKDFTIWTKDTSDAAAQFRKTLIDMGISQAKISDWQGSALNSSQAKYKLTVVDGAEIGDKEVIETNANNLAEVWGSTSGGAVTALDNIMAEQTLMIYDGPSGTRTIDIKDTGGDAKRSAASIAKALNNIDGVTAFASETQALFDISNIMTSSAASATQVGDEVQFSLYIDGMVYDRSFVVDSSLGTVADQFESTLRLAASEINKLNEDEDIYIDRTGSSNLLQIASKSGRTIGVQDLEVVDNAGIRMTDFSGFNQGDIVTFTLSSDGIPTTSTNISVDLTGVDTTNHDEMVSIFYSAFNNALDGEPFNVSTEDYINGAGLNTSSIVIRTTDGSNLTLADPRGDTGDNATIDMVSLAGTVSSGTGNTILEFSSGAGVTDTETFSSLTTSGDNITFSLPRTASTALAGTTEVIYETSAGGNTTSALIVGTITTIVDAGMSILSTELSNQGLYGTSGTAVSGSSILTLGGEDGFTDFTAGDDISFDVDGISVAYTAGPGTTEIELAIELETALTAALITPFADPDYTIIRAGKSVSIIKDKDLEDPIAITNFAESGSNDAKLKIKTGTGKGTSSPENDLLESNDTYRDFATSSLYHDKGIIKWEKFNRYGISTGASGLINVEDEGQVNIVENGATTLSFNISKGSLVAGNTLTINTNTSGRPDPLNLRVANQANSKNDIYHFKVISGGKVGHVPATGDEPLVIEWQNSVDSGRFTIEGHDPPYTPVGAVEIKVDGMILNFHDGTLFSKDVFTITTDSLGNPVSTNDSGQPSGERMSDWHWTMSSFSDQFNMQTQGMRTLVTSDKQLKFGPSDHFYSVKNIEFSGQNGFASENCSIIVKNWDAIDFSVSDLRFQRAGDRWGVPNDPTGGNLQIIPAGGDDDGFDVDFTGDGLSDLRINFTKKVTGNGYVEFDFEKQNPNDISYAFSDDASSSSGLVAALGVNTFFSGYDPLTMKVNDQMGDTKYVAAGQINALTGEITQGDNTNALAMTNIQHQTQNMKLWTFSRGNDAFSSLTEASFNEYYNTIIGELGVRSRGIKSSKQYADIMVNNITQQRDSVSGVSLDEEMIRLMKYQHAFSAASKLLTVADEMLNTLIAVR